MTSPASMTQSADETAMVQLTNAEILRQEKEAARMADVMMRAYLAFPVAKNFDLVIERMRDYQTAWMHGRGGERP